MGRARLPADQQKTRRKVVDMQRRRAEEDAAKLGAEPLKKPPKDMFYNALAEKEYMRHLPYMLENGAFDGRDRDNLLQYCNAFAHNVEIEQLLKEDNSVKNMKDLLPLMRMYTDLTYKFGRLCGFSPEARLKIAATKIDKEEKELERGFGNI